MPTVRERIRIVIFEAETPAGRFFDVWLLVAIVASVLAVSLDSVGSIREEFGDALIVAAEALSKKMKELPGTDAAEGFARLDALTERLSIERVRLARAQDTLDQRRLVLAQRLRDVYVRGEPDPILVLIESELWPGWIAACARMTNR